MSARRAAIVLAAAWLGTPSCPASAQEPAAPAALAPAPGHEGTPRKIRAKKTARAPLKAAAVPPPPSILGGETEASSLERRRRAFFATRPEEAAPDRETPSAGVTLGGSGGLSPGMGFKF